MPRRTPKPAQLDLALPPGRGGKRRNAGRKPTGARAGVAHAARARVTRHQAVHVTLRMGRDVPGLRNRQAWAIVRRCFHLGRARFGFRLAQFSIQRTHIHLLCEADDARALSRGMQGLCIRLARRVNERLGRTGKVFADRYHAHALTTPRAARHALAYVLLNARHHDAQEGARWSRDWYDRYSSAAYFDGWASDARPPPVPPADAAEVPVAPACGWLLTTGWRRHRLLLPWEIPGDPT